MTKIVVTGAAGRMGGRIIANAINDPEIQILGAVEAPNSPALGKDAALLAGCGGFGLSITDSLEKALASADLLIDFSHPDATLPHLRIVSRLKKAAVVGTTGHTPDQKRDIEKMAREIPLVMAPNMSIGVNVMWQLLRVAAPIFGPGVAIQVSETHHVHKKDKPSGTALEILEILKKTPGASSKIDVKCFREGEVVGDHSVLFEGMEESLEIVHKAKSRDTFAVGALRAAKWIVGRPNGIYSMRDVLVLKDCLTNTPSP